MNSQVIVLSIFLYVGLCCASTYPTTYPFSKETAKPPPLPVGDPWEFSKTDSSKNYTNPSNPGGFARRIFHCDPYSTTRMAFTAETYFNGLWMGLLGDVEAGCEPGKTHRDCSDGHKRAAGYMECRHHAYYIYNTIGKPTAGKTVNCTEFGSFVKFTTASGKVNGQQICSTCCKNIESNGGYTQIDAVEAQDKKLTSIALAGGCPKLSDKNAEPFYCQYLWKAERCFEFAKGLTNGRVVTSPCYDNMWRWFITCPLFKSKDVIKATFPSILYETPVYLEKLSVAELLVLEGAFIPDRVCHPYSYYHPDIIDKASATPTYRLLSTMSLAYVAAQV